MKKQCAKGCTKNEVWAEHLARLKEPQYTPTPWKVSRPNGDYSFVPMLDDGKQMWNIRTSTNKDAPIEMFERIVRAVNSHEELVNCLKSCRLTMNTAGMPVGHIDRMIAEAEGK